MLVLSRALVGAAHAEDVAQEALLVAFRRWQEIGNMRSPAGYVRGICLHKAVSVTRRRNLERQILGRLTACRATAKFPARGQRPVLEERALVAEASGTGRGTPLRTRHVGCRHR